MPTPLKLLKHPAVLLVAKLAVAVGLLAWLFARGWIDLHSLASREAAPLHAIALAVSFGGLFVQIVRWRLILRTFGVRISTRDAAVISMIGLFGSLAFPGFVGVEVIRAYYVSRRAGGRKLATSLSVLLDRLVGLYAYLALGVTSLVWTAASGGDTAAFARRLLPFVAAPFAAMTVAFVVPWVAPVRRAALRVAPARVRAPLSECADAYTSAPGSILVAVGLSLVAALAVASTFAIASRIAGSPAGPALVGSVTPVVVIAGVIPISPQGLGVVEASSAFLFAKFGIDDGATIALGVRVWSLALCLPGAVLYVLHRSDARASAPAE